MTLKVNGKIGRNGDVQFLSLTRLWVIKKLHYGKRKLPAVSSGKAAVVAAPARSAGERFCTSTAEIYSSKAGRRRKEVGIAKCGRVGRRDGDEGAVARFALVERGRRMRLRSRKGMGGATDVKSERGLRGGLEEKGKGLLSTMQWRKKGEEGQQRGRGRGKLSLK